MKNLSPFQFWSILSFYIVSIISIVTIGLPYRGDERHFVETIRLFSDNFSLNTLKDYPEVTPPLFYYVFAAWSKLFGHSIESLRIFNSIISFMNWLLIFKLNERFIKDIKIVFFLSLISVLNPYFLGMSAHVFTDMLTINFILVSMLSFFNNNFIVFTIFSTMAILTRQYAIIFPAGVFIYSVLNVKIHSSVNKKFIIGSVISLLPILSLFMVWQNISPKSGIEKWLVPNSNIYNVDYINSYITFSIIYILPVFLLVFKKSNLDLKVIASSIFFALVISLFPIKTSVATLMLTDYKTIGFAHEFLVDIFGFETIAIKSLLWFLLLIGCLINMKIIFSIIKKIKDNRFEKDIVPYLVWVLFLLVMPFSYQVWEKYLTMILPFLLLSIFIFIYKPISVQKK